MSIHEAGTMSLTRYTDGYARPSLAADIALFTLINGELHLLLIERGQEPFEGHWALPGGFVQEYEPILDCARRELEEETGFRAALLEQFGIFDRKGRDPRGWYISIAFMAMTSEADTSLSAGTDAADTRWFPVSGLPDNLAFDHQEIIAYALAELRIRAERFDLSILRPLFALLPEQFTLTQLQEAFDAIKGVNPEDDQETDKRNFRKRILTADIVEAVPGAMLRGKHRPAQLYTFRLERVSQT